MGAQCSNSVGKVVVASSFFQSPLPVAGEAGVRAYEFTKPYNRMAIKPALCYGQIMESSFEWSPDKDAENQRKHGVSFAEAQRAFTDAQRVVARDVTHSRTEDRYYCFGRVRSGILTVRFTFRNGVVRIIGAGFWRRGRKVYETQNHLQ